MNKRLKARIVEIYGTQTDFAIAIETHESVVSRVIRGRRILSQIERKRWAEALKCMPKNVFHEDAS